MIVVPNTIISARKGVGGISLGVAVSGEGTSYNAWASDPDISSVGTTASQAKPRFCEARFPLHGEAARLGKARQPYGRHRRSVGGDEIRAAPAGVPKLFLLLLYAWPTAWRVVNRWPLPKR